MSVHSNTNPDSQPTSLCSNFLMQCPANTDFIVLVGHEGRIQDFKLEGAHLKKLHRAEGGAKIVGVFRVKNHDFTPKNHIFSNFRGRPPPLDPPLNTPGNDLPRWTPKHYTTDEFVFVLTRFQIQLTNYVRGENTNNYVTNVVINIKRRTPSN